MDTLAEWGTDLGRYAIFMTPAKQALIEYSEDGVDLTLIRWMLSLTPAERLDFLQRHINRILTIRELNVRA
jgi:hypothetical protein